MMSKLSRVGLVLAGAVLLGDLLAAAAQTPATADAKILADFKSRIDKYMEVHRQAEKLSPPLKPTNDPAKIQVAQDALAKHVREARKDAKAGDIFTPEVRQIFRRLMYPETKGAEGQDTKAALKDDAPKGVALKVNAKYPDSAPLPTVPPNLLAQLPKLPEDLEYRIINKDLILRDVDANVIVDFIPSAIQ